MIWAWSLWKIFTYIHSFFHIYTYNIYFNYIYVSFLFGTFTLVHSVSQIIYTLNVNFQICSINLFLLSSYTTLLILLFIYINVLFWFLILVIFVFSFLLINLTRNLPILLTFRTTSGHTSFEFFLFLFPLELNLLLCFSSLDVEVYFFQLLSYAHTYILNFFSLLITALVASYNF